MRNRVGTASSVVVVGALLLSAGVALAASRSSSHSVTLCIGRKSGKVRVDSTCTKHERAVDIDGVPHGPAGGDLAGSYPNPRLKNPPDGTPHGPAGGDLTGTYPNPLLKAQPPVQAVSASREDCSTAPGSFCAYAASDLGAPATWSTYGGQYQVAGFWRDNEGLVHLRGSIVASNRLAGGADRIEPQPVVFYLPTGDCPQKQEVFTVEDDTKTSGVTFITVRPDCAVVADDNATTYASLSGITFRTD